MHLISYLQDFICEIFPIFEDGEKEGDYGTICSISYLRGRFVVVSCGRL